MRTVIVVVVLTILCALTSSAQVLIIANKSVADGSVSSDAVKEIYSLVKKQWSDGSPIVALDLKSGGSREAFYRYIGYSDIELKKTWLREQLSGRGKAPEAFASEEEIVAKVASTPGAIGYVSEGKATGGVKVIARAN